MIDFNGYTREAIQKKMMSRVNKKVDIREGSLVQVAVSPVAWYLEGLYMLLNQVQLNAYADTAMGECLDYICAERGITRKAAKRAVRQGTFDVEVPEGALFKTINGADSVMFATGELVSKSAGSYVYEMTCETAGVIGNAYFGNLLPVTPISNLKSAVLGSIIDGKAGSEEEEDPPLRERYLATFDVAPFGGNIAAYRNSILAISGVGAVQVYPAWRGGGTVLCSVLNCQLQPADNGLIKQIQAAICPAEDGETAPSANGYGIAPIGAAVTIVAATNLTLDITCNIQFAMNVLSGVETYQSQIEEKIQEYLDSVCTTWGNPLKTQKIEYAVAVYISRITAAILSIPAIVNVTNVSINGSASDLILTETPELQQIPSLGTVVINGG